MGKDPLEIEKINDALNIPFISDSGIIRSIIGAIDVALWDIKGQTLQKPIYQLLSESFSSKVQVYASGGSVAMTPEEIAADVERHPKQRVFGL